MIQQRNKMIGMFDSGFGGLNILRGIVKELPEYDYLYLGDTARAPYGSRSQEEIFEFTKQAVDFLFENDCALIILACNTASSGALRRIQQEYLPKHYPEKRVLGVLVPTVEETTRVSKNKRMGVIATEATVDSGAFPRELKNIDSSIQVFQTPCPSLVPLIESGKQDSAEMNEALEGYLFTFKDTDIDTLILGCTHYGIIEDQIKKMIDPNITIISEERVVPKKLNEYLERHPEIEVTLKKDGEISFTTTGEREKFTKLGSEFFLREIFAKTTHLH